MGRGRLRSAGRRNHVRALSFEGSTLPLRRSSRKRDLPRTLPAPKGVDGSSAPDGASDTAAPPCGSCLRLPSLQVGAARGVPLSTRDRDDVQGAVDLAVAAAVQAVAVVSAKLSQINETRQHAATTRTGRASTATHPPTGCSEHSSPSPPAGSRRTERNASHTFATPSTAAPWFQLAFRTPLGSLTRRVRISRPRINVRITPSCPSRAIESECPRSSRVLPSSPRRLIVMPRSATVRPW
jgi:hypothetical protein